MKSFRTFVAEKDLVEGIKSKMSPHDASEFLKMHNAHDQDFHALPSETVMAIRDKSYEVGFQHNGKTANGSRARYFHAALKRHAGRLTEDFTNDHAQAHELILHADNDHQLYRSSHQPIMANLKKKVKKGVYDSGKATKLWGYHADRAAQSYSKEHGDGHTPWHKMFTPSVRKAAAAHWEQTHRDELKEDYTPEERALVESMTEEELNELSKKTLGCSRHDFANEEVVSELKKWTLANYIRGAARSIEDHSWKAGTALPRSEKAAKHLNKVDKRQSGIGMAVRKLAKEEAGDDKGKPVYVGTAPGNLGKPDHLQFNSHEHAKTFMKQHKVKLKHIYNVGDANDPREADLAAAQAFSNKLKEETCPVGEPGCASDWGKHASDVYKKAKKAYKLQRNNQRKFKHSFRDAAVTGSRRDFANEEVVNEGNPHATFPNAHFVHGRDENGKRVYFTGHPGDAFKSPDGNQAFRYDTRQQAHDRAKHLNKLTNLHGVHFTVLSPNVKEETVNELSTGSRRDFAKEEVIHEKIGHIKKGAFHMWLGKSPDAKITAADIRKGLRAGGHAAKMAEFAHNVGHVGESVNEATWHQRKAGPVKLGPGHHVVIDPPNQPMSVMTHDSKEKAAEYMVNLRKNNPKAYEHAHMIHVKEETVNELSAKTMGDYVSNASSDLANQAAKVGRFFGTVHPERFKAQHKVDKRVLGIKKATKKIRKEEVVNELSKKTLGSYVRRATHIDRGNSASSYKLSADRVRATAGKVWNSGDRDYADALDYKADKYEAKAKKRQAGVIKAVNILAAEQVEQVDENYGEWHEKISKGSREGNEVQFKIKNAGGRTEAYKNGKKVGHYDHNKRMGVMEEGMVSETLAGPGHPVLAKLKKQYDENEDNNDHSTNAVLLAKHFGTPEEHTTAKQHLANRDRLGHGSHEGSLFQADMSKKYYHKLTVGPLKMKEDYNQTNNNPDFMPNVSRAERPAFLDKNRKRDQRRAFKQKYDTARAERKFQ